MRLKTMETIQKPNEHQGVEDRLDRVIALIESQTKVSQRTLFRSFMHGVLVALGASIGITIVLAILGWILGVLGAFPIIGEWFIALGDSINR
jgi:hypothetical protein